ncbi:hypothetical protein [Nodularia sp. UHCC 0506]|uniref:hypothetical protein n=1 Tax=Nodularia sp. UHCC 0506 TaxID=3110243 RepID=UPI002B1F0D4E|nr:hypothetical protein [Nodularia sp. UHCC 0506]MEA5516629.1 hypothetical protein [Nodularia sp. UHCC 0506]
MARIELDNLYSSNAQQLFQEITEGEMKTVEGSEGSTVTSGINDVNEQSLVNTLDQNIDNLLFHLRTQMGVVILGARNQFNQGFNAF